MKILNISDVITNSSSEVFIIHAKPEFQNEINEEVPKFLNKIIEDAGYSTSSILTYSVSDERSVDKDWFYFKDKNDLIINSVSDNTIPYWLIEIINSLYCMPNFKDKFQGYYAKDLGKQKLPYYDWHSDCIKYNKVEIESIQRQHLG